MKTLTEIATAALWIAVGFVLGSILWASRTPDQPIHQDCVPVYYSGLECCQDLGVRE